MSPTTSRPAWFDALLKTVNCGLFVRPALRWLDIPLLLKSDELLNPILDKSTPDSNSSQQQVSQQVDLVPSSSLDTRFYLYNPFSYRSAYALPSNEIECDAYATAFHGWQKGCVDYIFASTNELQFSRILLLPFLNDLHKLNGIPHSSWPGSDHFDLVADVKWTPKSGRRTALFFEPVNDQNQTFSSSSSFSKRPPTQKKRANAYNYSTYLHHTQAKRTFY